MDFEPGVVYEAPDSDGSWIREALSEVRKGVGPIPITLVLRDGTAVTRNLEAVDTGTNWDDEQGSVYLEEMYDEDDQMEVRCRDVTAFRLVPPPPIDHSDELRG
jgi:hypothetical protein